MTPTFAENASESQASIAFLINADHSPLRHKSFVLGSKQILAELTRRIDLDQIEKVEIAELLGIHPSQVTRLFAGDRQLKHDEAVKLVERYGLEPSVPPLPPAVWRLIARHIAAKLSLPLQGDDPRLQDLVGDLAAFSRFVRDRRVQGILEASEHFFEAMQIRREPGTVDPQETDPQPAG